MSFCQELKDVHHKDQMAAARGVLQRNIPMLYTASRACLQHPDVAAYKANRDLIYKQLQNAVSGISNAAQATATEDSALSQPAGGGELAYALNNFDVSQMSGLQVAVHLPFLMCPARHQGIFQINKRHNFPTRERLCSNPNLLNSSIYI